MGVWDLVFKRPQQFAMVMRRVVTVRVTVRVRVRVGGRLKKQDPGFGPMF